MTVHKDNIEMERAKWLKAARAAIRLKHALAADEEINDVLPGLEEQFNRMVADGSLPQLQVGMPAVTG